MEEFKNQILKINNGEYSNTQLLEYFHAVADKLNIGSVQDVSNDVGISQQSVRSSKKIKKIKIRSVLLVTSLIKEDNFPF